MQAGQQALEKLRLGQYKLKTREQIRTRVDTVLKAHKVKTFLSVKVVKSRGQESFHLEIQPKIGEL